jgi:hypothetical protein
MAIITPPKEQRKQIDLRGPDGNVFVLIGTGIRWMQQLGHSKEEIEAFKKEMMSSDYTHAVQTFDNHFGRLCDLIMPKQQLKSHTKEISNRNVKSIVDEITVDIEDEL